jgi:hypothetical protein
MRMYSLSFLFRGKRRDLGEQRSVGSSLVAARQRSVLAQHLSLHGGGGHSPGLHTSGQVRQRSVLAQHLSLHGGGGHSSGLHTPGQVRNDISKFGLIITKKQLKKHLFAYEQNERMYESVVFC